MEQDNCTLGIRISAKEREGSAPRWWRDEELLTILTYFKAFMSGLTSQLLRSWFGFALFPPLTLQSSENRMKQNHFRIYVCRVTTCFFLLITSEVKRKKKQTKLCLLPVHILSFCFPGHTAHSYSSYNPRVAEERFRSFPVLLACLPAHFIFPN